MTADRQPLPPRYRVLVVDDQSDQVELVARMLHGKYEVTGTTRSAEALALVDTEWFDVALVDQRLSDGTGTSILARCAQKRPLCRRIVMSGHAEMGDLLAAINVARVSRFLLKPFGQNELVTLLRETLAEYQAERSALEQLLLERSARVGERRHVTERRGGRRARRQARPAHWPQGPGVWPITESDAGALIQLFDPDVNVVVAVLRPERFQAGADAGAWTAELELRLVTRLRDSDQAFRLPSGRFVIVFARTSKDGCARACRRLADKLRGGLLVDLVAWPERGAPDPVTLVEGVLRSA